MTAIIKREISSFFSSPIAYLVIGLFLVLNGLFLWVFKGDFNIIESGFADMNPFFQLAPWILLFLIPAVTMKSFSEEKKAGTLELLLTRPISKTQIVMGKFIGTYLLVVIALVPTLLYVLTIWNLADPVGNIDMGSIAGSYFGLLFLIASYTAIGIFMSSLTDNQIVAFIAAVLVCFLFFYGFSGFSGLGNLSFMEKFSLKYHFDSIGRGVIDFRDVIYFVSISFFFLVVTIFKLK
ncbi:MULTISPECIES: gliding motility-associated ABC transporter permease subunit GldF [Galbibacter]|uniref:Gliding motility-associated ABC transporter permease subunit GldF n=1 Tax=Galbibacter pacificus TaxID=2996052 RepID=A0ABT6FR05_9FLAO|nr:gliding motility-associated ABC transporter permease subunit GldF [Galbibacter pacificus]MDG3581855.1 gliding motility-associated ABC transporter permease subunit GldF [Galbibacter pacificus]MDG3585671.1 gliding motility-associated ABC transporter permease subunit GldF [Galbibacter pacificus]